MRWDSGHESSNVEDQRGQGGGGFPIGKLGLGGTIVLVVLSLVFGRKPPRRARLLGLAQRDERSARRRARPLRRLRPRRHAGELEEDAPRADRQIVPRREARPLHRRRAKRLRLRRERDGAVLLSGRREGLHRPRLLPRAARQARRPGRLRAGVRHRARDRSPRAEHPRHRRDDARQRARQEQSREERAERTPRAPGRLLRGHLGELDRPGAISSRRATSKRP